MRVSGAGRVDDEFGEFAGGGAGAAARAGGARGEQSVDEDEQLFGAEGRAGVAEGGEFVFQEAVDGAAVGGGDLVAGVAGVAWWTALAPDRTTQFTPQDVLLSGDRATFLWHYRFGPAPADWVSGANIMRIRNGVLVEALGFSKTAGEVPLAADTAS